MTGRSLTRSATLLLALTMCGSAQAQSIPNGPNGSTTPSVDDPIRPTRIDPAIVTYGFDQKPVVRKHVGHDEPFLEGVLTYGYGGRVETPVMQGRDTVIPADSPAFGVPMVLSATGTVELVWCAIIETPRPNWTARETAGFGPSPRLTAKWGRDFPDLRGFPVLSVALSGWLSP